MAHHVRVSIEGSQIERRSSVFIGVVRRGSSFHQIVNHRQLSFQTPPAERRQTLLIHQIQTRTYSQTNFTIWEFLTHA